MPAHIPRPDYADHPQGHPLSEIAERGSTTIKVLDDEEIEGLKVACKVRLKNAKYNTLLNSHVNNDLKIPGNNFS